MKVMYPDNFTLDTFIKEVMTDEHRNIFKNSIKEYTKDNPDYNYLVVEKLKKIINNSFTESDYEPSSSALDFFDYIYGSNFIFESMYKILKKEPPTRIEKFKKYYEEFKKLCDKELNKRYFQKKSISEEYHNEDIIITDACYLKSDEESDDDDYPCDLYADTIYGDWGCTVYNKDTKEKIGKFCSDASNVCIARLNNVLKKNPNFKEWMEKHDWCVALIKNFNGIASINYDIEEYEYEGKQCRDLYCYIEGIGNINFIAGQTDF